MFRTFATIVSFAVVAFAANHDVDVGNGGLSFSPDTITAAVGDTVTFHFYPGDHSVVSSDYATPCQQNTGSGAIFSGYFTPSSGESSNVFVVTIADMNPIWLFCAQIGHCKAGMVAVINPPSSGDSLSGYIAAAADSSPQPVQGSVEGGQVMASSGDDDDDSSSSSGGGEKSVASSTEATSAAAAETTAATSAGSESGEYAAAPSPAAATGTSTPAAANAQAAANTQAATTAPPPAAAMAGASYQSSMALVALVAFVSAAFLV